MRRLANYYFLNMKFYNMKINLAILYGIDDKFFIVKNTIEKYSKFFDKIIIINTGGTFTFDKLKSIKNRKIEIYNQNMMWGDTDSSRRYALNLCDYGDWMFWLDSDECPTKILLDNLQNIVLDSESEKCPNIRFPSTNHMWDSLNGGFDGTHNVFCPSCSYYGYDEKNSIQPKSFIFNRMLKKIDGAYFFSSCGGHSQFSVPNDIWKYSNYPINHYKTSKTCSISAVLHTWSSMRPNFTLYRDIKQLYNSAEYQIHSEFKKVHDVGTPNKLICKLMNDLSFKEILKNTYYTNIMEKSKFHFFYIYYLIRDYNFDFVDDVGSFRCGLDCCKY